MVLLESGIRKFGITKNVQWPWSFSEIDMKLIWCIHMYILFMGRKRKEGSLQRKSVWIPHPFSRMHHHLGSSRFHYRQPTSDWSRHWKTLERYPCLCCPYIYCTHSWKSCCVFIWVLQQYQKTWTYAIVWLDMIYIDVKILLVRELKCCMLNK